MLTKWINIPHFFKQLSVAFLVAGLAYFAWKALFAGLTEGVVIVFLLCLAVALLLQIQYMLFRYFEKKGINIREW